MFCSLMAAILPKIILLAQLFLLLWRQRPKIAAPTGAKIDLPTPVTREIRSLRHSRIVIVVF